MQKNYVYASETEVVANEQNEEINQNEEQYEADNNINDEQNNENESGNGNDNLNNNENNNLNNNNDNLFNISNDENENKGEDKDKTYNINISNEINNNDKNDLNEKNISNENDHNNINIMNIDQEDKNAIEQNNDLNQSNLSNKINDNNNYNDNNKNENIKNNNDKSDTINDRINNDTMNLNDNNNNNNNDKVIESETDQIVKEDVITYKRNAFITNNFIKETDQNEIMTSKDLFAEQGNKDNYKNKKNLQKNITLDVEEDNSESRFNGKNENKNKNEKKNSQLSISYKVLLTIIYILFGHCFIFTNNFLEIIKKDYYKLPFLCIIIPYFFVQILINILLFFPYIFKDGFDLFLSEFCFIIKFKYNNIDQFPIHFAYYSAKILFLGTFLRLIKLLCTFLNTKNTFIILIGILLGLSFLPFHIIINIIMLIYFIYRKGYDIRQADSYFTN